MLKMYSDFKRGDRVTIDSYKHNKIHGYYGIVVNTEKPSCWFPGSGCVSVDIYDKNNNMVNHKLFTPQELEIA